MTGGSKVFSKIVWLLTLDGQHEYLSLLVMSSCLAVMEGGGEIAGESGTWELSLAISGRRQGGCIDRHSPAAEAIPVVSLATVAAVPWRSSRRSSLHVN